MYTVAAQALTLRRLAPKSGNTSLTFWNREIHLISSCWLAKTVNSKQSAAQYIYVRAYHEFVLILTQIALPDRLWKRHLSIWMSSFGKPCPRPQSPRRFFAFFSFVYYLYTFKHFVSCILSSAPYSPRSVAHCPQHPLLICLVCLLFFIHLSTILSSAPPSPHSVAHCPQHPLFVLSRLFIICIHFRHFVSCILSSAPIPPPCCVAVHLPLPSLPPPPPPPPTPPVPVPPHWLEYTYNERWIFW